MTDHYHPSVATSIRLALTGCGAGGAQGTSSVNGGKAGQSDGQLTALQHCLATLEDAEQFLAQSLASLEDRLQSVLAPVPDLLKKPEDTAMTGPVEAMRVGSSEVCSAIMAHVARQRSMQARMVGILNRLEV